MRGVLALVCLVQLAACASPKPPTTSVTAAYLPTAYGDSAEAQLALENGDWQQALFMADRAVAQRPGDGRSRYERATALAQLGRTDDAVRSFVEAETAFGNDETGVALAAYGRARALDQAGRCAEARQAYEDYAWEVRAVDPEGARIARAYAAECRERTPAVQDVTPIARALSASRYGDALALAERLPAGPERDFERGLALIGLGRTDEALGALDDADRGLSARQRPEARALALFNRARALREAHRCDEAARAYETYASFVQPWSQRDADMARAYARQCPGPR